MGVIKLPSVDSPPYNAGTQAMNQYIEQLANLVAIIAKELQWLVNGNLDVNNIRAKSITADRLKVDELSAITANLGHIKSGLVESIKMIASEIYGSYIATAEGTYPRTEMDVAGAFLAALASATRSLKINPVWISGSPRMVLVDGITTGSIFVDDTFTDALNISTTRNILFNVGSFRQIKFPSWGQIYSVDDAETLQNALSSMQSQIDDLKERVSSLESA